MANSYQFDPKYSKRMAKKIKITQSVHELPKDRFDHFKKLIDLMNEENDKLTNTKTNTDND